MIEITDVYKTYDKKDKALRGINLTIEDGEFVFVVGNSGSGKSTLIRLLMKEIEPTLGSIKVGDIDLSNIAIKHIPKYRRTIGAVFQDFRLLNDRSVYENIAFAQRVISTPLRNIKVDVPKMLRLVGLTGKYNSSPNQLSGGEKQRVAIARALINKPKILLADEPTGNLDPKNSDEIMKLLEEINAMGTTVVVVTHSREIVDRMKKRVVTMRYGSIVSDEKKGGYNYEN